MNVFGSRFTPGNWLIDLNVLPPELRPKRYPSWYVAGLVAIVVACGLLGPLALLERSAGDETSRLREELTLITSQLQGAQTDMGQGRGIRTQIAEVQASAELLQSEKEDLLGGSRLVSEDLTRLYAVVPPDARVTLVNQEEDLIIVKGEAVSTETIIAYADALQDIALFPEVTITSLSTMSGGLQFAVEMRR